MCVCGCARHAKTSRNLPVIQLARAPLRLPLPAGYALSIEIELYCSFLEHLRRSKAKAMTMAMAKAKAMTMADVAFCLPGKLLSPSCFPL